MSTTRALIRANLFATQALPPPAGGGGSAEVLIDVALALGIGPNQFEKAVIFGPSMPGGSFTLYQLQGENDVNNVNAVMTGVIAMSIEWPATADGPLEMKPDVATPWIAWQKDVSDVMTIQPGTKIILVAPQASAYPVTPGSRSLRFDNTGTVEAAPRVTVLGTIT